MIYLDYAAATPVSEAAKKAMEPYFSDIFFNPSSPYLAARKVRADYEAAKEQIAHAIGAKGANLVMTSGATEANNLAFSAVDYARHEINNAQNERSNISPAEFLEANPDYDNISPGEYAKKHKCPAEVLILSTEHDSVVNVAKNYAYDEILVDRGGLINLDDLKQKLNPRTVFISVALANNELGTIQPLFEIAEIMRGERLRRLQNGEKLPLYLHSDASQAVNLLNINVSRLGVDLLTLNSAKVYGPKGVGALFVAPNVRLRPVNYGGGQEMGLRSGTENVPGVVGFATATREAHEKINQNRKKYEKIKQIFQDELKKFLTESEVRLDFEFLGPKNHQLANFSPLTFPGIDAERLIFKLEEKEIYVSTGAACAASKGEKSRTLRAVGLAESEIAGSLRITFGKDTTEEDARMAAREIAAAARDEFVRINRAQND